MWDSLSFAWIGLGVLGQILYKQESPKFLIKEVLRDWGLVVINALAKQCFSFFFAFSCMQHRCRVVESVPADHRSWHRCRKLRGFSMCRSAGSFENMRFSFMGCRSASSLGAEMKRYLMGGVVQHVTLRRGIGEVSPVGCHDNARVGRCRWSFRSCRKLAAVSLGADAVT
ncbi:unnamed protein product [Prunus armeniaca]